MANIQNINALTGEVVIVEMTPEQITDRENDYKAAQIKIKAEADAKVAARESALAKLAALGLTADEIGAL